jgi:hypothetical protein
MNHFASFHLRAARAGAFLVKTCLAGCLLAGGARNAKCQEGSTNGGVVPRTELDLYPVRVFGNTSLNLTPLVQWWDLAALARRPDVDGQPYTNQLPRRPLTDWFRIKGDYVRDAYEGWQINATIEDYPGHGRPAVIILRHPPAMAWSALIKPRQEIQAEIDRISAYARQQNAVDAAEHSAGTNQISENQNAYVTALLSGETAQAASNEVAHSGGPVVESVKHHDAEVRIARLREQLRQLPVIEQHRVDLFAAKVGYITGTHLEAFDFGVLPFGGVQ